MVFGLFSKDRALKKAIDKATNVLAQSVDRWAAMERLRDNGTDEALYTLCKRFSFNYDKMIEDQQEKQWVVEVLVGKGPAALGPLKRYMKVAEKLGYPLTILPRIANLETVLEVIDEILEQEEPGYTRLPQKRIDIIEWLGELDGVEAEDICRRLIPYLEDHDENVKIRAVESIALRPHESAVNPLVSAMIDEDDDSGRLKRSVAAVLSDNSWSVGEKKAEVSALLERELEEFKLQGDFLSRRDGEQSEEEPKAKPKAKAKAKKKSKASKQAAKKKK